MLRVQVKRSAAFTRSLGQTATNAAGCGTVASQAYISGLRFLGNHENRAVFGLQQHNASSETEDKYVHFQGGRHKQKSPRRK